MIKHRNWRRWASILLAAASALLLGFAGRFFFARTAYVSVDLRSNIMTDFKIYWAKDGQAYEENRSASIRINPVQARYHIPIADLGSIQRLRIDPSNSHAGRVKVLIRSVTIHQPGYAPLGFVSREDLEKIRQVSGFRDYRVDSNGLMAAAENNDPQLEVPIQAISKGTSTSDWARIGFVLFLVILFFSWIGSGKENLSYVPVLLSFAAAFIAVMAVFSRMNVHPDEYVHIDAALYYEDHFLPPEVCAPGTEQTYSVYGVSRLNSQELIYPLAGKFSRIFSFLPIEPYLRLRLFNVVLFILICAFCLRFPDSRALGAVFLVSPQIWYVFSYFNSDAFSLWIIFLAGYQVLGEDTLFSRYVAKEWSPKTVVCGIGLGLFFSMLLFIKKNFYVFIVFLALYILWRLYFDREQFRPPRRILEKLAFLFILMIVSFSVGLVVDYAVNGSEKSDKILECRQKLADIPYKPDTPLDKKHPWMMLKKKGVSLMEMFTGYRWGSRSFKSAFGVYGYTTIAGPEAYYKAIRVLALGFLAFLFFSAFLKPRWENGILFLIVFSCSVLLLEAALWRAWTVMLQPQGRYFLPIGIMAGFMFHRFRTFNHRIILNAFIFAFFLLSVYSFIFVGWINIPKQGL